MDRSKLRTYNLIVLWRKKNPPDYIFWLDEYSSIPMRTKQACAVPQHQTYVVASLNILMYQKIHPKSYTRSYEVSIFPKRVSVNHKPLPNLVCLYLYEYTFVSITDQRLWIVNESWGSHYRLYQFGWNINTVNVYICSYTCTTLSMW